MSNIALSTLGDIGTYTKGGNTLWDVVAEKFDTDGTNDISSAEMQKLKSFLGLADQYSPDNTQKSDGTVSKEEILHYSKFEYEFYSGSIELYKEENYNSKDVTHFYADM